MPTRPRTRRHRPLRRLDLELTMLCAIAEVLVELAKRHVDPVSCAVRVLRPADVDEADVDVRFLTVPGDPVDALLGFLAPEEWTAIGVLAADDDGRVTVHLVDRGGRFARAARTGPDGPLEVTSGRAPVASLVDDVCRRALRLPAARPSGSTAVLLTAQWLDRVAAHLTDGGAATWPAVASLHPVLACHPEAGCDITPHELWAAARQVAAILSWEDLRVMSGGSDEDDCGLGPARVGWMDDGMFARWTLECFPDIDALLDVVDSLSPPSVAVAVRMVAVTAPSKGARS